MKLENYRIIILIETTFSKLKYNLEKKNKEKYNLEVIY